ncbi:DNA mismatch repair MSH5 isoform X2 [Olea europaea subsp. europaea]|uniref:DNA mismatch repair MSH5 isoform X2 n=1 Tax=Olea europaea subsp. europaea TaxID=158383 RepID=A0A8S0RCI1_OLEEU|nr:DNA mismatch repair MSH5 isoform X2 [Olea europaea subsp. europaea]
MHLYYFSDFWHHITCTGVPEEVIKRAACVLEATGNKKNIERVCSEDISAQDQLYKAAVEKMLAFDTSNGDLGHFFEDIFPSHHDEDENPFNSLSLSQGMGLCNRR